MSRENTEPKKPICWHFATAFISDVRTGRGMLIGGLVYGIFSYFGIALMRCPFKIVTGLPCPGCGMTRAAHATLQGRLVDAFRFNPVGMILLPVASVGLGIEALNWVRKKPLPFRMKIGARAVWFLVGIIIGFGILRNIPLWPFTQLAPP